MTYTMPRLGTLVHYVSYGSADGRWTSECRAAHVTETHGKTPASAQIVVGLMVLNPTGVFFDREVRQSEDTHTGGTWHYPCVTKEENSI